MTEFILQNCLWNFDETSQEQSLGAPKQKQNSSGQVIGLLQKNNIFLYS